MTSILIDAAAGHLLLVAGKVLTRPDIPDAALIGGLAVTIRVAAPNISYRATGDIDIVTDDDTPTLVEILTSDQATTEPVVIDDVRVDIISTEPVDQHDLEGMEDGPLLFVAGHRWALDTATDVTVATTTSPDRTHTFRVASPAGLVAAKSHAIGYARSQRRSTKHGADLLDLCRLVEVHGADELADDLREAPGRLAALVAEVVRRTILARPGRAAMLMTPIDTPMVDVDHVVDLMGSFVRSLDGS